jgi:hypothetical protein
MADNENHEVFTVEFDAEASGLNEIIALMKDVAKAANDAVKGLKLLEKIDLKNLKVDLDTGTIKKQIKEVDKDLVDLKKKFKDDPIQGPEPVGRKVFNTDELIKQFQAVGETAEVTNRSVGTMFRDFNDGLSLLKGGGNAFVGIQQAMFGLSGASGTLGKAFGFLTRNTDEIGKANDRMAQAGLRASAQMAQLSSTLVAQTKILKDVAASELGLPKAEFNRVDQRVQAVEKAYKDLQTTIEGGGKATTQQISRIKTETKNLEQVFVELKARGVIPAGTATEDLVNKLIEGSAKGSNATRTLVQQYHAMADAAKKAEEQQAKGGKTAEKQEGFFRRLIPTFGLFSRGARDSAKAIDEVSTSSGKASSALGGLETQVGKTGNLFSNLSTIVTGSLIGGTIIAGFGLIKDQLAGLATAFFEPNKAVQDFRITMANMMKGTGLDVEETQARIESFVRDVVAKTPFELTDAFESFQKLLISGFDPQKWLIPVADAAAAVNKPMEQLIGAMAKIQVGAKGAGVDMLRDFGIPVNQVGSFVDKATGQILSQDQVLNENRNLYKLSAEQLDELGISFNRLEFDKQGSLINSSADALNILNGYLQQNATFAGAAEGRSRSLGGVISNLKDFVTNLAIVAGQPIFEKLTIAGQLLLDKLTFIQPFLNSLALTLGGNITSALDYLINLFQNFSFSLDNLPVGLQNVIATIDALIQGDWNSAWGFFLTAVDSAVAGAADIVGDLISQAFDWGISLGNQLADGIYDAASGILTEALNFIGETISSFLAPGSPPEQGPLSTIDKWGKPLGEMYSNALADGISPKPINSSLDVLAQSMSGQKGPLATLLEERQKLLERLRRADELGLDTTFLNQQLKDTEAQIDALAGQAAEGSKAIDQVEGKKSSGAAAPSSGGGRDSAGPREKKATETFQEKFEKEKTALEERKAAGLISQSEYLNEMLKLEKDYVKKSQEEGITAGLEEHVESIKTLTKQAHLAEQQELTSQFNAGILSEEEYAKGRLKIQEEYFKDRLALGLQMTEDEKKNLQDLQAEVDAFKKKGKGGEGSEVGAIPTAGDILSGFGSEAGAGLAQIASEATTKFVDTLKETTKTKFADFKVDIQAQFASLGEDITAGLSKIGLSPEMLAIGATVAGVVAILLGFGGALLYVIPLVGLVALAILNWDTISQGLRDTYNFLNGIIDTFITNLGGQEKAQQTFNDLLSDSDSIAGQFGKTMQKALSQVFSGDFSGASDTFSRIFSEIDITGLTTTLQTIGTAIGNTIWSMLPVTLQDQLTKLKEAFNGLFADGRLLGELSRLFEALSVLRAEILPGVIATLKTFGTVIVSVIAGIVVFATSIVTGIVDALPFIEGFVAGIVRTITGFVEIFTGVFQIFKSGLALFTGDTATAAELFKQGILSMQTGAVDIMAGILATITNAGLALVAFVNSFFLTMIATVLSFIPGFANAGAQLFAWKDLVIEGLSGLQEQATEILFGLVDQIKTIFLELFNYLVGESLIPDMVDLIIETLGRLTSEGITVLKEAVKGWIESFKDAASKFKETGENIILGLLEGMKKAQDKIIDFLKTLIQEKIIGGVKAQLGIESPSVVMAELGEDTMKGYQEGIEGQAQSVEKGTEKVFRSIFFKILKANGHHSKLITDQTTKLVGENQDRFAGLFESFGAEIDDSEVLQAFQIMEQFGRFKGQAFRDEFKRDIGVNINDFIKDRFKDFVSQRNQAISANLSKGEASIASAIKIFEAFEKTLANARGSAITTKNILEHTLGRDLVDGELAGLAAAVDLSGPLSETDKAILDAYNAQQKFNGALEQQKLVEKEMAKIEEQRAKLDFLRTQLDLINQAKAAGVGSSIIEGIGLGADIPVEEALRKMQELTAQIIEQTKKDLKIASPSAVFMEIGKNITEGMGVGLGSGAKSLEDQMASVIQGVINIPENISVSRPGDFSRQPVPNQIFPTQQIQQTNNISDKLDAALFLRKQEEMFAGAFR